MSFASDLFSGLTGFRDHLVANVESAAGPVVAAVEGHLARLEPLVRSNILGAEDEAKAILHELYGSVVGEVKAEVATPLPAEAPAAPAVPETSTATEPAPAETPQPTEAAAPVAVDPTPAPESTEASSAPSSTTSDTSSTPSTDAPAA